MQFDTDHLAKVRTHLLGPDSASLIHLMHLLGFGQDTSNADPRARETAVKLQWIDAETGALTALGTCAADSCREYQFWLERGRKAAFEDAAEYLSPAYFQGRKVLEIGAGMGANLMSLSAAGASVLGVDPIKAYIQLGEILSEREGLPAPDLREGTAEKIPFEDASADVILCISAHQYFDIWPAFDELARVVKQNGELILVGGTFKPYFWGALGAALRERRGFAPFGITVANSLSYMATGRRAIPARTGFSTSRPIYPTQRSLQSWLGNRGFEELSPPIKVGPELCLHLRKR